MNQADSFVIGPLKTRDDPPQARARQRVSAILRASAELLCTHSVSDISTTLIAEKAAIPVSSVYRYFPTIDAIIDELYWQTTEQIDASMFEALRDTVTHADWKSRLGAVLDTVRHYFDKHPYYRKLLQAIFARSGSLALDRDKPDSITSHLAEYWRSGGDNFSGADPVVTAQITMQVFLSVEGILVSQAEPDHADDYFDGLKLNLESYLANFLSD
jgi:AcrR family transcriptional regulator